MLRYRPLWMLFALFVVSDAQWFGRRQTVPCTTPANEQGRCIPLEQCSVIINLTNRPSGVSNQEREYIQQSQCGRNTQSWYSNVCCPNSGRITLSNGGAGPGRNPGTGNQGRPGTGNQGRPGTGNQGRPDVPVVSPVQTGTNSGNGVQGSVGNPGTGNLGRPGTGNQGSPGTGNQGLPDGPVVAPVQTGTNTGNGVQPKNAALLAEDQCGRLNPAISDRVLGGSNVELGEFPWMALVQYSSGRSLSYRCGGVLINKRYVLTAAHCAHPGSIGQLKPVAVRLGEHDKQAGTEARDCVGKICSDPVLDVAIEQQIYHPSYSSTDKNNNNDVALFRLSSDVRFTEYIKPICLPHQANLRTKDYRSQQATLTGWGRTDDATGQTIFASSNVLQKASLPIVDNARCSREWGPDRTIRADMFICAGGVKGTDACKGDSGGPLIVSEANGRFHVIGLVSYGERCTLTDEGRAQKPGVYTRVSFFVDWILDQLRP